MKIGIIGLPQSGKTTVFNAASGKAEAVGDYSKASHRAIIKVPDARLDKLSELVQPKKTTFAEIDYLDIAAFSGKGKQSDASSMNIPDDLRYSDALMVVINCFADDCTPERNFGLFLDEMILSDQVIIERNIDKKERTAKLTGDKSMASEVAVLRKCLDALENEKPISEIELNNDELRVLKGFKFLSQKPLLVVLNYSEGDIGSEQKWLDMFKDKEISGIREFVSICGNIEMEMAALDAEDRTEFLADLGIERPAMEVLIQKSYSLMGLISYFTVGEPDAHAWTIKSGTNARKGAGAVHSDIERGFIRAEVITYDDFVEHGSTPACKEAGKYHVEGKEYLIRDGDIILFRFNV
ncbi:MAG: YchF family ATPase [candidate division Zixibacteria bacterium]|nr:YchF family ATPase [candidate division Zixibacteria bacterium]